MQKDSYFDIPTIRMDTQHSTYNHPIIELFKNKSSFRTQNGQGIWNRYGSSQPIISAFHVQCLQCTEKSYDVYSYATLIYLHCDHCGYSYCNVAWHSKQTTWLQNVLAECFSDFKKEYEAHKERVKIARKWLTTARREKYGYSGILDEKTVLDLYDRHHEESTEKPRKKPVKRAKKVDTQVQESTKINYDILNEVRAFLNGM